MYYRPILKKSFDIVIRYRFLWILGFFTAFLANGSVYDVLWHGWNSIVSKTTILSTRVSWLSFEESGWLETYQYSSWLLLLILILLAIFGAGFVFLIVSAQGGLIFAAKKLSGVRGKVNLKTAWKEGIKKFWHLLAFNLLGRILIFILLFLASIPVFLGIGGGGKLGYLFSLISFLVFIPLALMASFVVIYGLIHIMLKKADIREAFYESLFLFRKFWLQSLEFALILLGINLLLTLILALLFMFLFLPFLILGTGLFLLFGQVGPWINIVMFIVLCAVIFILAGSVFGAFQMVAWTLFYLKISRGNIVAKVVRWLERVFKKQNKK